MEARHHQSPSGGPPHVEWAAFLARPRQFVVHSQYVFFQMAEVPVPRKLFAAILERIDNLYAVTDMARS